MANKQSSNEHNEAPKPTSSESGLAGNYAIEVIGLLGLATLIYATLALFFIS